MEQNIEKALRSLPRTGASPEFTSAVVSRLDEPAERKPIRALAAACAAAVLISALAGGQYVQMRRDEARLENLRVEQKRIASELEELKRITSAYEPLLYVGRTEEVDLYVDLRETAGRSSASNSHIRPASTKMTTDF